MKKILVFTTAILMVFSVASLSAQNFTKKDASFVRKYVQAAGDEIDIDEDEAKLMVKFLDSKYESLLKNESNKKVALEIMQKIEKALDNAKDQKKEENWNDAATWSIVGMIWVQALDIAHNVDANEKYYNQVKKTK